MADKSETGTAPHDQPGLETLARDYMDLWQEQLSTMARDETLASVMAQVTELINNNAAAVVATMTDAPTTTTAQSPRSADREAHKETGQPPHDAKQPPASPPEAASGTASGPASAGPAPGSAEPAIQHLTERIERLERRLVALESGTGSKGAGSS